MSHALVSKFSDAWLIAGQRTPFVDYASAFAQISPTDLAIKAARAALAKSGVSPEKIGAVVTGTIVVVAD